MQIILNSLEDTYNFAGILAPYLQAGDVVALEGDLGAGKTTLAKSIIRNLTTENTEVISPTFNIVQLYDTADFTIWHFDFYRLKNPGELVEIGLDEALGAGVCLIEWPEIAGSFLPEEKLIIHLSSGKENERVLRLEGHGKWKNIVEKVKDYKPGLFDIPL